MNKKRWQQLNPLTQYQNNRKIIVKRSFQQKQILQAELLVGDIIILKPRQIITVDGILLKTSKFFFVNQSQSITLKQLAQKKHSWQTDGHDPFIFAGTQILEGNGQVLVLTVGQNCTFRKIKKHKTFLQQRGNFCKDITDSIHWIQIIIKTIMWIVAFLEFLKIKMGINIKQMTWIQLFEYFQSISFNFTLILLIDEFYIADYLCNFAQNNQIINQFTMVKKQILLEIMKIDILFIQEPLLQTKCIYDRNILNYYQIYTMDIINQLQDSVHIKILTSNPYDQLRELEIDRIYNADKQVDPETTQIFDFRQALFIADQNVTDLVYYIFQTFRILGYNKIGIVAFNPQPSYLRQIIITTSQSDKQLKSQSWLQIKKRTCQLGLKKIYLLSSVFHLLYYTYFTLIINNIILSIYLYIWSKYKNTIKPLYIVILSIVQYQSIYRINLIISNFNIKKIEPTFRMKKNLTLFNVLSGIFHIFAFIIIQSQQNLIVYLICNSIMRKIYLLRNGEYNPSSHFKSSYTIIFLMNISNIILQWYQNQNFDEQIKLLISLVLLRLVHYLLRELDKAVTKKRSQN